MTAGAPGLPLPPQQMVQAPQMQPVGEMAQESSHLLGLSMLAVAAGAALGIRYGGLYGGIAGGLVGGAGVNAFRALHYYKEGSDEGDKEARVSATYAALATALSGYLLVRHVEPREEATPNPEGGEPDVPVVEPSGPCAIRAVGPRVVPTAEMFPEIEDEP
jgi:hypothetical protein